MFAVQLPTPINNNTSTMAPEPNDIEEEIVFEDKAQQKQPLTGPPAGPDRSVTVWNTTSTVLLGVIALCSILAVAELGSIISLQNNDNNTPATVNVFSGDASVNPDDPFSSTEPSDNVPQDLPPSINRGTNVCAGKKPQLPDAPCVVDAMTNVGPQAGANVTAGYNGNMEVDYLPITTPYWMNGMCPVNVHWHLGAEHYSVGEYDETGTSPISADEELDGDVRAGYSCKHYNASDPKFTRPYNWQYCKDMQVGATYEVHWPHSAAGACGTPNQYQTPFYDGVFCVDNVLTDTAAQVGVQAQVFTIVNDEQYFWPDLMRGMIVDGEMGQDIAKYTGSTTGSGRNNEICSQYSPITWQVDRKCHLISASTFDKMCHDMLTQRDDMSDDVHPHGSRMLVDDDLAANNHNRFLKAARQA